MNYDIAKPSELLAPFVRCYWSLDVAVTGLPEPYRVVPQGCVELMFFYKTPYADCHTGSSLPHAVILGQQSSYLDLQALGDVGIFSVLFKPHGAKVFFKTPLNEVTNLSVSLCDFSGKNSSELIERIVLARTNAERVQIIESYLLARIREKELEEFNRIEQVMNSVRELRGEISIDQMSYISCLGRRQLARVFQKVVGMTPKQYLKIVRFQHVLNTKQLNPKINLTHLAFECGYHDQAHFANDFKRISGESPKNYFSLCEAYSDFFSL